MPFVAIRRDESDPIQGTRRPRRHCRAFSHNTPPSRGGVVFISNLLFVQMIFSLPVLRSGWVKFVIGWIVVFVIRLVPFRPPNIEGVLATTMPFGKRFGWFGGFLFGFFSIALFDTAVGKVGIWTFITAAAYGALGIGAHFYFRNRASKAGNYVVYAVIATLLYDATTGLSVGPLFFGQPFMEALIGQIPFTFWHLAGNVTFAALLSPALYRWVAVNPVLETDTLFARRTG